MRHWKLRGRVSGAPGSPLSHLVVEVHSGPPIAEHKTVEVVPLSEVREALLGKEVVEILAQKRLAHRGEWQLLPTGERQRALVKARRDAAEIADAAFPSTESEGQS